MFKQTLEKLKTLIAFSCKSFFLKRLSSATIKNDDFVKRVRNNEDCTFRIPGWYPRNLVISTVNESFPN